MTRSERFRAAAFAFALAVAASSCRGAVGRAGYAEAHDAAKPLPAAEKKVSRGKNKSVDGVTFSKNGKVLVSYPTTKGDANYLVPSTVEEIADGAFSGNARLKTLVLPYSVRKIGRAAFENCVSLVSIEIPDGVVELGEAFMAGCASLRECRLPESLEEIPAGAFMGCTSLEAAVFTKGTRRIGQSAFEGCSSLERAEIPPEVAEIPMKAFYGCSSLKSVRLGSGISVLEPYSFAETGLVTVEIPAALTRIGECAFNDCHSLLAINVSPDNPSYRSDEGILLSKNGSSLHAYPAGKPSRNFSIPIFITRIEPSAFHGNRRLESVEIPAGVKEISYDAFAECAGLQSISISGSVRSIKAGAFSGCVSLRTAELSEGLTEIGALAFEDCRSLSGIWIPSTVRSVGSSAFKGCSSLSSMKFAAKEGWTHAPPPSFESRAVKPSELSAENFARSGGKFFESEISRAAGGQSR